MRIGAVILAAGAGRRMGGVPKALLEIEGRTFLDRAVETSRLAGADPVVVVAAPGVDLGLDALVNPDPARGMFSSVQIGIDALLAIGVDGVLIFPVDHPHVAVDTVRALLDASQGAGWTRPVHHGRAGHPIVIGRDAARALLDADPGAQLREALRAAGFTPRDVVVDDPGVVSNVNEPRDLEPPLP